MVDVGAELGLDYGELTSVSVAAAQLDGSKHSKASRNKRVQHFLATLESDARRSPPKLLHGIVRIQSAIRGHLFRKNRVKFGWPAELQPVSPETALGLHLGRRLRNPGWVDLGTEARVIADLYCGKRSLNLRDLFLVHSLQKLYSENVGERHVATVILKEKRHMMVVEIQERLQGELIDLGVAKAFTPIQIHNNIQKYRPLIPDDLQSAVLGFAEAAFQETLERTEAELAKELRYSVKVYELHALEKKIVTLFGKLPNRQLSAVKNAISQRREFLIYELQTSWEWPLTGAIPGLKAAARDYLAELAIDEEPVMQHFVGDVIALVNAARTQLNTVTATLNAQLMALRSQLAKARVKHMKMEIERELSLVVDEALEELTKLARTLGADEVVQAARVLLVGNDLDKCLELLLDFAKDDAFQTARLVKNEPKLKEKVLELKLATDEELAHEDTYYVERANLAQERSAESQNVQLALNGKPEEFVKYKNLEYQGSLAENSHTEFFANSGLPVAPGFPGSGTGGESLADTALYQQLFSYRQDDAPEENLLGPPMAVSEGVVKVVLSRELTSEERGSLLRVWTELCEFPIENILSVGAKNLDWYLEVTEHVEELIAETKIQKQQSDALNAIHSVGKLSIDDLWAYDALKRAKASDLLSTLRKGQQHAEQVRPSAAPAASAASNASAAAVSTGPLYVSIDPLAKKTSDAASDAINRHPLYTFYDVKTMGPVNPIELKFNPRARFFLTRQNPASGAPAAAAAASPAGDAPARDPLQAGEASGEASAVRATTASL